MYISDIVAYQESLNPALVKFECKMEDDTVGHFVVHTTKETYHFEDEMDADALIDNVRRLPGFVAAKKKYKAGKISKKTGELLVPELWVVSIELNH